MATRAFAFALLHVLHLSPSSVLATQWQAVSESEADTLPSVELSLAPPLHPWPQVAAELGNLEESREKMESDSMDQLQTVFGDVEKEARKRIAEIIGSAMRTLDSASATRHGGSASATLLGALSQDRPGDSVLSLKVKVQSASPPDPLLRTAIDDLESLRSGREKEMLESARGEAQALVDFVINELQAALQERVGAFLGGSSVATKAVSPALRQHRYKQLPAQANVRVVPSGANYPTVSSMVQAMEARRDIAEELERRSILERELDLLTACNKAIEETLKQGGVALQTSLRSAGMK